jgi:hypothetical protein
MLTGEAEQHKERGSWRASSVKSECELVEVVGRVFPPQAIIKRLELISLQKERFFAGETHFE